MADETVDPKYKMSFNIAYHLTQSPETAPIVERMIEMERDTTSREGLEAGRKQHEIEMEGRYHEHLKDEFSREGARLSQDQRTRDDRDATILKEYHDKMGPLPTPEQDAKILSSATKDGPEREPDPLGPPPIVTPGQKPTPEEAQRFQAGSDRIKSDGKQASNEFDKMQAQRERDIKALADKLIREAKEREKDKDRDR